MRSKEFQKLAEYQKEVARLEKSLAKFNQKLLKLPAKFGFGSVADFIAALEQAAGGTAKSARAAVKTGKRAKITTEIKQRVKAMVGEDKTGAEIAAELGISLPSVQNIKKELGLVKKRGK